MDTDKPLTQRKARSKTSPRDHPFLFFVFLKSGGGMWGRDVGEGSEGEKPSFFLPLSLPFLPFPFLPFLPTPPTPPPGGIQYHLDSSKKNVT